MFARKMCTLKTSIIIVFGLLFRVEFNTAERWKVNFDQPRLEIPMLQTMSVPFNITGPINTSKPHLLVVGSEKDDVLQASEAIIDSGNDGVWNGHVNITSIFIGRDNVTIYVMNPFFETSGIVIVDVKHPERLIDKMYTISVVILVAILYINLGCSLDWLVCQETLERPIGPVIGIICQSLVLPLASFAISFFFFPMYPELNLGIFFAAISPTVGITNIWTTLLDGNSNLSFTMTTIGTWLAFVMVPFWLFTLGRFVFALTNVEIPYFRISMHVGSLLIPLALGYVMQEKFPKFSRHLLRILKPLSIILTLFVIVFAVITNVYPAKVLSSQIIVAGMILPCFGVIFGYIIAAICKQTMPDARTISMETGIQSIGVAIFLLKFGLTEPEADLTTMGPVSCAIMTPLPLVILYVLKRCCDRRERYKASISEMQRTTP